MVYLNFTLPISKSGVCQPHMHQSFGTPYASIFTEVKNSILNMEPSICYEKNLGGDLETVGSSKTFAPIKNAHSILSQKTGCHQHRYYNLKSRIVVSIINRPSPSWTSYNLFTQCTYQDHTTFPPSLGFCLLADQIVLLSQILYKSVIFPITALYSSHLTLLGLKILIMLLKCIAYRNLYHRHCFFLIVYGLCQNCENCLLDSPCLSIRLSLSVFPSVCPHGTTSLLWTDFNRLWYLGFSRKVLRKFKFY
jgi:hypothetical protein